MNNLNDFTRLKEALKKNVIENITVELGNGSSMQILHKNGKFAERSGNVNAAFARHAIGLAAVKKIVNNAYWVSITNFREQ